MLVLQSGCFQVVFVLLLLLVTHELLLLDHRLSCLAGLNTVHSQFLDVFEVWSQLPVEGNCCSLELR